MRLPDPDLKGLVEMTFSYFSSSIKPDAQLWLKQESEMRRRNERRGDLRIGSDDD